MDLARSLGNRPGNLCTPTYLAEQAQTLQQARKSVKVKVLEKKDMEKLGMGSLLSVARGSRQPPKLIIMEYSGGEQGATSRVVLVGKGVTFDSGGISIKPAPAMDEMKFDMCGAASVLGTSRGRGRAGPAAQRDRHRAQRPRTCPTATPASPATSSPACRARPSKSSTPTPRAGWSCATP